jgi:hypothetical protein
MEDTSPRWNNLSMIFLHHGVSPTGGVEVQVTQFLDPVSFMSGGWRKARSLVVVTSAALDVWCLAVGRMDDDMRKCSSSSTALDEVPVAGDDDRRRNRDARHPRVGGATGTSCAAPVRC